MLFFSRKPILLNVVLLCANLQQPVLGFSGSEYTLDTEYSGANFFDGWDFFTGRDPTGGFVTYYSRSSSHLASLINATDATPAYMGVDYVNQLPLNPSGYADGAGRPSVRISSKRSWTHGLFIGDFNHAPSGICGTWPAFWTLGPNWPYTGEVDIMESVNKVTTNAVSLHTNETCFMSGNSSTQTGTQGNTNCAYYPDYNVGCGVVDTRPASYSQFNSVGGGVYAMQWTSEYIRVWFFQRGSIPQDIVNKKPNPSSWGLPAANMMGNCTFDQHFQQHKIIFDTTFCGEYAGNPWVWNSTVNSCAIDTGYSTCDAYVARRPDVFRDAYWSINYVRVYQLVDSDSSVREPQYIASLQPASTSDTMFVSSTMQAPMPTASLCPTYNFTTIQNGGLTYEIECDYDPPGPDIPPPYPNFRMRTLEDCVAGCTYWNTVNGTNLCGGVSYNSFVPFCYFKKYIDQPPNYRKGFAGVRLIYYGYPQITDDPRSQPVTSTSTFIETIPSPQSYRPQTTLSSTTSSVSTSTVSLDTQVPPPLGTPTNTTSGPTISPDTPTVSFSGNESIPITISTTVRQNTTNTLTLNTTTASSMTVPVMNTNLGNTAGTTTITIVLGTVVSSSTSSTIVPMTSSSEMDSMMSSFLISSTIIASASTSAITTSSSSANFELITTTKSSSSFSTLTKSETTTIANSQISSTTMVDVPGPTVISNFRYVGCKSNLYGRNVLMLSDRSENMTLERCIDECNRSYYAALLESACYCINTPLLINELVTHRDSDCGIPCPGNVSEKCGGYVPLSRTTSIQKRQASNTTNIVLLTLYMNMGLIDTNSTTTVMSLSATTRTVTLLPVDHPQTFSTTSSQIYNASITSTMTVTEIATTWCDYCPTCSGYQATLTTTITVPCTVVLSNSGRSYLVPTVPMVTTSRECHCGPNGAPSTMTVTIPHETKIALLTKAASQVLAEMSPETTTCQLTGTGGTLGEAESLDQATAVVENGAGLTTMVSVGPMVIVNGSNVTLPVLSQLTTTSQVLPKSFTSSACENFGTRIDVLLYFVIGMVTCLMQ